MGRIVEAQRIPTADAIHGHWGEAETVNGGPITVELPDATVVTRAQFLGKRNQYHGFQGDLVDLDGTQEPLLISEREAIWGSGPDDEDGVWFRLRLYKGMVKTKLGTRHPLTKTVPNLGVVQSNTYVSICHRFEDHWTRLLVVKPGAAIGSYTLANLQANHAAIEGKNAALETLREATRPLTRAEMERLYGDVTDEEREPDSIVAVMLGYTSEIQTRFPGKPIALSLPGIFPDEGGPTLPTFRFNWVAQAGNVVKTWIETPNLPAGALVFLKEGVVELTQPFNPANPGSTQTHLWNGIQIIDELDEFEIRNGDTVSSARGVRDTSLPEPVGP